MEFDLPIIYALPAIIAFVFKVILLLYANASSSQSKVTRLFVIFLFALSLNNLAEVSFFLAGGKDVIPVLPLNLYFLSAFAALALFVHLFSSFVFGSLTNVKATFGLTGLYGYAGALAALLLLTPWLITGYAPLGHSYYRVPGPLYFLFEIFALVCFAVAVAVLIYGALRESVHRTRIKCQLMLVGIAPMTIIVVSNIALMHYGITWLNTPMLLPAAITFFLVIATYAIVQYRIFDIQFYIPWSSVRKRKSAFYQRIRSMIAEIADLDSPSQLLDRLADTLRCPVALVGGDRPVLAGAGGSQFMAALPREVLARFDHIVVANEIADRFPDAYQTMQRHGVAAIVPFYPHSKHASGWLLLGDSFSEQVYTRLDFKMVEQLFDKMADLFLDKLLTMRNDLAQAARQIREFERRNELVSANLATLSGELESLRSENTLLRREQAADSLSPALGAAAAVSEARATLPPSVTLLGRDKAVLKALRGRFPQVQNYVGADSAGFRRQPLPEVVVACVEANDTPAGLIDLLVHHARETTILLYGAGAAALLASQRQALRGCLVEALGADTAVDLLAKRIQALAVLRRATFAIDDPDQPLIGTSLVMKEQMAAAARLAGFREPLLLRTADLDQAVALARHLHARSGVAGGFAVIFPHELSAPATGAGTLLPEALAARIADSAGGTLVVVGFDMVAYDIGAALSDAARTAGARLIISTRPDAFGMAERYHPMVIDMPSLRERRADLPLLVHYFTLQHNLQSGCGAYLKQSELDDLLADAYPEDLANLKRAVFSRLAERAGVATLEHGVTATVEAADRGDTSLDRQLEAFEARVIAETLERCGGNKSKAARLLGLKPNTLHYKIERYGLTTGKKS